MNHKRIIQNENQKQQRNILKVIKKREIINEANKIIRERNKHSTNTLSSKIKSKFEVLVDSREVCMKNYVIDLLKSERTCINDKELAITKALSYNEIKLETDVTNFIKYIEEEKKSKKAYEEKYLKVINDNKAAMEKEKYLIQENKQIVDELEKTVKMILNLKTYAFFVHMVLGEPLKTIDNTIIHESSLQDTLTRDKNIEKVCSKLISELGRLDLELSGNLIENSNLTAKFNEMEENILKLMDKKHEIDKELKILEEQFAHDKEELAERERAVQEEKTKIDREKNKEKTIIDNLKNQTKDEGTDKDMKVLVQELIAEARSDVGEGTQGANSVNLTGINYKKKEEANLKDLIDLLKKKEKKIINLISELEEISQNDPEIFKDLVGIRKDKNKENKLNFQKAKQKYLDDLKEKKANERSNRIVIKGRKIMEHGYINKGKKKKENLVKINDEQDEKYMLYYEEV